MRNEKIRLGVLIGFFLLLSFIFIAPVTVPAQTSVDIPFTLPQTIFVGDLGRLVVPLGRDFIGDEPYIAESADRFAYTPDLVIRRVELERRGGTSRLLIDFVPFATGFLTFPDIEFFPHDDQIPAVSGLQVYVSSILAPAQMTLSAPAPLLAVPGTSLLIYGTVVLILFLLFLGIGGSIWSRRHFWNVWELLRRRFLILKMKRFVKHLKEDLGKENSLNPVSFLSSLSGEFREFLTFYTGINCRSLTAGEFLELPIEYPSLGPVYLSGLFHTWDTLRFSGRGMEMVDLTQAISEIDDFLANIEKAERERGVKR